MAEILLSTSDNPFNPFTQWDEWYAYDAMLGHHTPEYLARIVRTSYDLSEAEQQQDIVDAIEEILKENVLGIYIKVTSDDVPSPAPSSNETSTSTTDAALVNN